MSESSGRRDSSSVGMTGRRPGLTRAVPTQPLPRRGFLTAAVAAATTAVVAACGGKSKAGDDIRIALLSSADLSYYGGAGPSYGPPALFTALANSRLPRTSRVVSDVRLATNQFAELDGLAAEILAAKPDVIVSHFPEALGAASRATDSVPIVSLQPADPARQDLLNDLHSTRSNVTGSSDPDAEVYGTRVELLKEAFPHIQRLAVFIGTEPGIALEQVPAWSAIQAAAARLGLSVEPIVVASISAEDGQAALARIRAMKPDALLSVNSGGARGGAFKAALYEFPFQLRIPQAFDFTNGVIGYFPDYGEMYAKAAEAVVRILKGERPTNIPVHIPKMRLTVNAAGARQIGLTVAPSVLAKADRVIQ
jgi:putative ABC transport system substrate-binding protein